MFLKSSVFRWAGEGRGGVVHSVCYIQEHDLFVRVTAKIDGSLLARIPMYWLVRRWTVTVVKLMRWVVIAVIFTEVDSYCSNIYGCR